jgi:hypothetical protein
LPSAFLFAADDDGAKVNSRGGKKHFDSTTTKSLGMNDETSSSAAPLRKADENSTASNTAPTPSTDDSKAAGAKPATSVRVRQPPGGTSSSEFNLRLFVVVAAAVF